MEELRQEIQQIRDEMNHTIEAIQERVSPQHLMEQAREAVQEVTHGAAADVAKNARDTAATAGSAAWNTVREHPIPVALAGLGLGWLLTHRSQVQQTGRQISEAREQITGPMGAAATQVQESAQQIGSQIGSQAASQVNRASGALQQALHDNPLAIGAAALAVGAVVGLAVPQTQQEHQLMGPARDQLVAKAQETAHEVAEQVQTTAQETVQKIEHVAQEARDAAQRTAQQEGLLP
jgi:ribosome recycling factor